MKRLLSCALLLAAPLFVLAASAQGTKSWMAGTWFGYGQPGDKSQMWLGTAAPDGKFHVLHRQCVQGKAIDSVNDGSWSLSGDILTVRIERVNGQSNPRSDVYRVLSHDNMRQTYRYEATGFIYNSRKVDGKFQMPPCDLSS